jgi:hypothetical protein
MRLRACLDGIHGGCDSNNNAPALPKKTRKADAFNHEGRSSSAVFRHEQTRVEWLA